jgi:aryl-phospho-beta-D-glucosidase BglC (GH1 family)
LATPDAAAFHALPPLAVQARHLVQRDAGSPIRLRGVNRSGLEYADPGPAGVGPAAFLDSVAFDEADLRRIAAWGANVVRVPFTQDFVLRGRRAATGADYLGALDQVVAWAEAVGLYTLLDLQWIDAETPRGIGQDGSINRVPALPDAGSIDLWRLLASRYRDRPSVLFDLFNEPHTPMQSDEAPLIGVRPDGGLWRLPARVVGMDEWQPWALRLIDEIRGVHPEAVIFVSGVGWAYDLRGFPLRRRSGHAVDGLVYSTHVYPWTTIGMWPRRWEQEWHRAFGHLAGACPVFAGEWGGDAPQVDWGRRLLAYLEAHTVGWTAWSWCDWPPLLGSHRGGDFTCTPFGEVVKAGLGRRGPGAPGLSPTRSGTGPSDA